MRKASRPARVIVWLVKDVRPDQREAILGRMTAHRHWGEVTYVDSSDALVRYKDYFKDQPELLARANPGPDDLPETCHVTVADASEAQTLKEALTGMEGVRRVTIGRAGK